MLSAGDDEGTRGCPTCPGTVSPAVGKGPASSTDVLLLGPVITPQRICPRVRDPGDRRALGPCDHRGALASMLVAGERHCRGGGGRFTWGGASRGGGELCGWGHTLPSATEGPWPGAHLPPACPAHGGLQGPPPATCHRPFWVPAHHVSAPDHKPAAGCHVVFPAGLAPACRPPHTGAPSGSPRVREPQPDPREVAPKT